MGDTSAEHAKLLFVLSNDYGELSNAMSLLMGYEFRPVVLMPERLFIVNTESLSVPHYPYSSCRDVTDYIDSHEPDIVFLFSGYLYSINNLFDIDAVETLIGHLRRKNHRIVTSDPFLGVLSRGDASTFSDRHPRKAWLTAHFSRLSNMLQGIPHLYLGNAAEFVSTQSVRFYNKHIIVQPSVRAEFRRELTRRVEIHPARQRWLFVLSSEDYGMQVGLHGRARLDDLLIQKLEQTARDGRQPVLIAPQACIDSIKGSGACINGLVQLPFCSYQLFSLLVLEAEYVFYWNIFSNSILPRVMNCLPVFFFDPGHMVRAIPPLAVTGMKQYYADSKPTFLDPWAELTSKELAVLASAQAESMSSARENFQRSPSPLEMVERLLER